MNTRLEININDIQFITTENDNINIYINGGTILTFSLPAIDRVVTKTLQFSKELAIKYSKEFK